MRLLKQAALPLVLSTIQLGILPFYFFVYHNSESVLSSLGVHEHWNDNINKQYTKNLGTGEGIELVRVY